MKKSLLFLSLITCPLLFLNAQVVTTLAGDTITGSVNGTGTTARFTSPSSVVLDGSGNLYVADAGNNEIRKINISSGVVTTLAGSTASGSANGTGTAASFKYPRGIAYDGSGNLYVGDEHNNEIRKINISSGAVTTLAGSTTSGSADGTGTAASFYNPNALATDGSGNLYVTDATNNEIRKIIISSGVVTTLVGSTTAGSADGIGTAASFHNPAGIVYDGSGNLYVTDANNNEIRKIVISSAVVTTIAGSTIAGSTDATGTAASFYNPTGITIDGIGNLYVSDHFNNEIRKIVISSTLVSTLAGDTSSGSANGICVAARFYNPTGITTDGNGNLYVADYLNEEIRMITGLPTSIPTLASTSTSTIILYPNPASQMLYVQIDPGNYRDGKLKLGNENTQVNIYNTLGGNVCSEFFRMDAYGTILNSQLSIDISSLPLGMYFISLKSDNGVMMTEKFVKQ